MLQHLWMSDMPATQPLSDKCIRFYSEFPPLFPEIFESQFLWIMRIFEFQPLFLKSWIFNPYFKKFSTTIFRNFKCLTTLTKYLIVKVIMKLLQCRQSRCSLAPETFFVSTPVLGTSTPVLGKATPVLRVHCQHLTWKVKSSSFEFSTFYALSCAVTNLELSFTLYPETMHVKSNCIQSISCRLPGTEPGTAFQRLK